MRRLGAILLIISTLSVGVPTVFGLCTAALWACAMGCFRRAGDGILLRERSACYRGAAGASGAETSLDARIDRRRRDHPPRNGLYFDIDEIVKQVISAPAHTRLALTGIEIVPFLRTEHLLELDTILGDFSTPLMGSPARVET